MTMHCAWKPGPNPNCFPTPTTTLYCSNCMRVFEDVVVSESVFLRRSRRNLALAIPLREGDPRRACGTKEKPISCWCALKHIRLHLNKSNGTLHDFLK